MITCKPKCSLFLALFLAIPSGSAHAYLDPATGSMILQMIVGGIAGSLVVIRLYWYRLKLFFQPSRADIKSASVDGTQEKDE